jgi:glycosyltransferase involved in cell wall biosynthesis
MMALLSRLVKRTRNAIQSGSMQFAPVLKETARNDERYQIWIENHRWNNSTEEWCRRQMDKFTDRFTVGILMECFNPKEEFLRESLSSIFNQIYPFTELSIVDRGSTPEISVLLRELENDHRVKVFFQKGSERDVDAIAKIMKKASAEWILLMGAEDILEPNALYNMVATLQSTVEIDFVFSDSDLIDDNGLRLDPQFKPVWAVGAHYPLGYYQHPVLLHDRLVKKLGGHERISVLMLEGTLLDDASNHSRYVAQAPGVLYHGRARGGKNEKPPEPVDNVLINENLVVEKGKIEISTLIRAKAEPKVPLKILWAIDSLDRDDGPAVWYHFVRYLSQESGHKFSVVSLKDGPMHADYQKHGRVEIASSGEASISEVITRMHEQEEFDVAFVSSVENIWFPEALAELNIPALWQLYPGRAQSDQTLKTKFDFPATILFLNSEIARKFKDFDSRNVSRILPTGVDFVQMKTFKQRNSPFEWRAKLGVSTSALLYMVCGPTIERKGQKTFVTAAIELLKRNPDKDLQFFIVGTRPGPYLDEMKEMIEHSPCSNRFHLVPETTDIFQYYPYYLISDVCVSCSTQEVFPLTILEAMAMKKPVVATRVFSSNETIEHDENGYLVEPGNANELAERLDFLTNQAEFRDFFGRRSLEIIYEKFHFRKIATRLEDLLRESIVYQLR